MRDMTPINNSLEDIKRPFAIIQRDEGARKPWRVSLYIEGGKWPLVSHHGRLMGLETRIRGAVPGCKVYRGKEMKR